MNSKVEYGMYNVYRKNRFFIDPMTDDDIKLYKEIPSFETL